MTAQQQTVEVSRPHLVLALCEAPRALAEYALLQPALPLLRRMPAGDGHAVMVLPGFMGSDKFNQPLVRYLRELGYRAGGWGLGRNRGVASLDRQQLELEIDKLTEGGAFPISLVGHSLGGIYAREIARRRPDIVRQVISLGSPFGHGGDAGSNASRLYDGLNPDKRDDHTAQRERLATAPPVPTTAVYTRGDGVVNWRTAMQHDGHDQTQNIRVQGSHCGLTLNAAVWYILADRLAQPADNWQPFSWNPKATRQGAYSHLSV